MVFSAYGYFCDTARRQVVGNDFSFGQVFPSDLLWAGYVGKVWCHQQFFPEETASFRLSVCDPRNHGRDADSSTLFS